MSRLVYPMRIVLIAASVLCLVAAWGAPVTRAAAQTGAPFRVYFMFEDGPTDVYTPEILDILAQYGAHATFFPNGWQLAGREAILQRIIREGHAIGNHLWTEPGYYAGAADEAVLEAYRRTDEAIRAALGPELPRYEAQTRLFLQPGGSASPLPLPEGATVITYNWHVQSDDCGWTIDSSSGLSFDEQVLQNVLDVPQSPGLIWNVYDFGDGAIISMHDINRVAPRLLPRILEELQAAGATFHALPRPGDEAGTLAVTLGASPEAGSGVPGVALSARLRDYAFVRAAPDTSAEIVVISVPPSAALVVTGRTADSQWFRVEVEGRTGWMFAANLRVLGPIPSLPVIAM